MGHTCTATAMITLHTECHLHVTELDSPGDTSFSSDFYDGKIGTRDGDMNASETRLIVKDSTFSGGRHS